MPVPDRALKFSRARKSPALPVNACNPARLLDAGEQLGEPDLQGVGDLVERGDAGARFGALDLREEADRESGTLGELLQRQGPLLAQLADGRPDIAVQLFLGQEGEPLRSQRPP